MPVSKRQKASSPQAGPTPQPKVDAELLRILLERARDLSAGSPPSTNGGKPATAAPDAQADLLKMRNGHKPPSTKGTHGKK